MKKKFPKIWIEDWLYLHKDRRLRKRLTNMVSALNQTIDMVNELPRPVRKKTRWQKFKNWMNDRPGPSSLGGAI